MELEPLSMNQILEFNFFDSSLQELTGNQSHSAQTKLNLINHQKNLQLMQVEFSNKMENLEQKDIDEQKFVNSFLLDKNILIRNYQNIDNQEQESKNITESSSNEKSSVLLKIEAYSQKQESNGSQQHNVEPIKIEKSEINIKKDFPQSAIIPQQGQDKFNFDFNNLHTTQQTKTNEEMDLQYEQKLSSVRHLIFGQITNEVLYQKHVILTYRGIIYAIKNLKSPSQQYINSKLVNCPTNVDKKKTLILDLDETLIHCCTKQELQKQVKPEVYIKINNEELKILKSYFQKYKIFIKKMGINIRPYCIEFLQKMSQNFEIFIFTASQTAYAESVINYLDPNHQLIKGLFTRQNCMETKNGFFLKDLRIFYQRELSNIVIVDNLAHSFGFQIDNGIPLIEWFQDKNDLELYFLEQYLADMIQSQLDVREYNRQKLRLRELALFSPQEILNMM